MTQRRFFKGFSTIPNGSNMKTRDWTLYDLDLVKRDLLNHFHTFKGERAMMPEYGCVIWDMLFEPLTETNIEIIVDDAKRIINSDSRVREENINIREFEHGLIINFTIFYEPLKVYETFSVEFDRRILEAK